MKTLYTLIFTFLFLGTLSIRTAAAAPCCGDDDTYEGYIVTLDGKKLTGQIGEIFFSDEISVVLFINDFGTPYHLQAELITGFVYEKEDELIEYESLSKGKNQAWSFLKVMHRGAVLSLFKSPEEKTQFTITASENDMSMTSRTVNIDEYWLKFKGERSFKLGKLGYKRKLKQQLQAYPAIAKKIGKTGYKFQDMEQIVEEVNKIYRLKKRTL
ncbi:MAG: hypothetical protein AAGI49_11535 [Bacteroidota bacterium]